jgi:hypothetical protein
MKHRLLQYPLLRPFANSSVQLQVVVLWVVTLCSVAVGHQHLGGPCCLHPQQSPPRRWYPTATLYCITTQRILTCIFTAMDTWNLTAVYIFTRWMINCLIISSTWVAGTCPSPLSVKTCSVLFDPIYIYCISVIAFCGCLHPHSFTLPVHSNVSSKSMKSVICPSTLHFLLFSVLLCLTHKAYVAHQYIRA